MNGIQQSILQLLRKSQNEELQENKFTRRGTKKRRMEFSASEKGEKRKRSSNFHSQEIDTLLTLINTDKVIIECKKTDQITNGYKDRAWKKIAYIFNQLNPTKRSDKQLRSKWETLKKNARREYATNTLTNLSEKVRKILESGLENEMDSDQGAPLLLKEEPFFDNLTFEENEMSSEMDQWSPTSLQPTQEATEVFQQKTEFLNSTREEVGYQEITQQVPDKDSSGDATVSQNLRWKPIAITQAFVAPPGILLPNLSRIDTVQSTQIFEKDKRVGASNEEPLNGAAVQKKDTNVTRGTQYECPSSNDKKVNRGRKFFCCHSTSNSDLVRLRKKLLLEENRRKKEKHEAEMEILKVELQIKMKQLENLE